MAGEATAAALRTSAVPRDGDERAGRGIFAGPGRQMQRTMPGRGSVPASGQGPKRSVLVADDDLATATALRMVLQLWGFEVTVVHDGEAALAALRERRPELALLDLSLPRLDGLQVARKIRQEWPGGLVRLMAVTGYGDPQHRLAVQQAGFDEHLVKPIDPVMLRARLARP
jgi:CheY-like chemotaxis protein